MSIQDQANRTDNRTAKMKRAPVHDGTLEYQIRGDGEPVLFIHGSHIAASFLPVMDEPALADYRLVRYHRRGFAGSAPLDGPFSIVDQAADAAALLRHVGVDHAHIVGHSYGGVIALQLALDAPDVVHSLALLEPALMAVPSGAAFYEEAMAPAIERYEAGDSEGAVETFMQVVAGPEWRTDLAQTVPGGPAQAIRDAATFFEVEVPALDRWEFGAGQAEDISRPVLYVLSGDNLDVFEDGRNLVRNWWPRADVYRVPGVGHSLQMKDPEAVAEGIADFLRRHPLEERSNQ